MYWKLERNSKISKKTEMWGGGDQKPLYVLWRQQLQKFQLPGETGPPSTLLKMDWYLSSLDLSSIFSTSSSRIRASRFSRRAWNQNVPVFYVGFSKEDIFFDHLLWPIFQSTMHIYFTDYNSEGSFHVLHQLLCPLTCCGHSLSAVPLYCLVLASSYSHVWQSSSCPCISGPSILKSFFSVVTLHGWCGTSGLDILWESRL